jgi:hypothetical protein
MGKRRRTAQRNNGDISASDCFILTSPEVAATEQLGFDIKMPKGCVLPLPDEAVYSTSERSVAACFTELGQRRGQLFLLWLVKKARGGLARRSGS